MSLWCNSVNATSFFFYGEFWHSFPNFFFNETEKANKRHALDQILIFVSWVSKLFLGFLHSGNFNQIKLFQMTFHGGVCPQCWALMGAWVKRTKLSLREKTNNNWTGCILLLASCGLWIPQDQQKAFNHLTIAHLCCSMRGALFHWHVSKA